jgi:hypothetical protein
MFSKFLKRATIGLATTGVATFGASYYLFPDVRKDSYQLYKASERVARLGFAGAKMAYIYGVVQLLIIKYIFLERCLDA